MSSGGRIFYRQNKSSYQITADLSKTSRAYVICHVVSLLVILRQVNLSPNIQAMKSDLYLTPVISKCYR